MNACLKELKETEHVNLFVANKSASDIAPFDDSIFSWIENRYQWKKKIDQKELISRLEHFQPNLILASNWHNPGYRKVLKYFKGRAFRIFGMDNQWLGKPKQWLGIFISQFYLKPICDALFVAGDRQVTFANKLGFGEKNILRGAFSCDHDKFAKIHFERKNKLKEARSFVFVGRFLHEKGITVLIDAYRNYRESVSDPWTLKCYGKGPLLHLIKGVEGIEYKGFCQPDDLPKEFSKSSCLILPSTFEPWALVVHEAAAAGMSVIVSNAAGASVHLVQNDYNGYIVEAGDSDHLTRAMFRYSSLSRKERVAMGENSYLMSLQFTPKRWANTLASKAREFKKINDKTSL
jgi:glycosyltransferase involved in cell wall biosynthesis